MKCSICPKPIPDARLRRHPRTVTCSPECSVENTRRRRNETSKAWQRRATEALRKAKG